MTKIRLFEDIKTIKCFLHVHFAYCIFYDKIKEIKYAKMIIIY